MPLLMPLPLPVLPKLGSLNHIPTQPMETLFKDQYFVSGSGIVKLFKDPAKDEKCPRTHVINYNFSLNTESTLF